MEKYNTANDKWRQRLHIEPPSGWLNDPNGLCWHNGYYHVYFQYTPEDAYGKGKRGWGHYRSADLTDWEFTGMVLRPDIPEDRDGAYSGCAVPGKETVDIYYTGNVKESGDHDYILSGRGAYVIHVSTADGHEMGEKKVLLANSDYPPHMSCHVRDPKVWREDGRWYMVLGARTRDDKGCVLLYESPDGRRWSFGKEISVPDMGYMWECPDIFSIGSTKLLSISPQGLEHTEYANQNIYSSGYMLMEGSAGGAFEEWDHGFDFYAPQTFEAPDGRRMLIAWMGMGDIPYTNPTASLGRQHCLTLPREISADDEGHILQQPMHEIESLRAGEYIPDPAENSLKAVLPFDITASHTGPEDREFCMRLGESASISWKDGVLELKLSEGAGCGRDARRMRLDKCSDLRIIADRSSLEIFAGGGRGAMSTRFYPDDGTMMISARGLDYRLYPLKPMSFRI